MASVESQLPVSPPPAPLGGMVEIDGVSIVYASPRRLCVLLRGLTEGTARHYGETAAIDDATCMHRGDSSCRFDVRFSAAAPSA